MSNLTGYTLSKYDEKGKLCTVAVIKDMDLYKEVEEQNRKRGAELKQEQILEQIEEEIEYWKKRYSITNDEVGLSVIMSLERLKLKIEREVKK